MNNLQKKNQQLLDEIHSILTEEVVLYESLADTAYQKQKAILENNVQSLAKFTGLEQTFIRKGNALTSKRLEMTSERGKNHKKKIMSLASFIGLNNLLKNEEWVGMENRLNKALTKVKRLNQENSILLKTSINFVQDLIRLYYPKNESESKIYTRDGKTEAQKKAVVDCGV
ncbi:MAG: hypothetical protein HND50_01455 [Calditrichaeota bacterium]|nr:hypothetical protein [Calditrichota bacterium]